LEIIVGKDAFSPAAHAAVLTAVSVGRRTFVGGVRVKGALDQPLNSALPLSARTLGEAAVMVGASQFEGAPSRTICIAIDNHDSESWSVAAWWDGWRTGNRGGWRGHLGRGRQSSGRNRRRRTRRRRRFSNRTR